MVSVSLLSPGHTTRLRQKVLTQHGLLDYNEASIKEAVLSKKSIPARLAGDFPQGICQAYAQELCEIANLEIPADWRIYCVSQRRGYCYFSKKWVTIPLWVLDLDIDYIQWHIAHELSHLFNYLELGRDQDHHGPNFMRWLKLICPANAIHHELSYKPQQASAAGIIAKPTAQPLQAQQPANLIGKQFAWSDGHLYTIYAIKASRPKYPIRIRREADGKQFKMPYDEAAKAISKMEA